MTGRLGFCCKWVSPTEDKTAESLMNQKGTTITALSKLSKQAAYTKVMTLVNSNMNTLENLMTWASSLPDGQKLLRLGSEILPAYTHEVATWIYQDAAVKRVMQDGFEKIGALARSNNVRITMHPGQYCLLNSKNQGAHIRAIQEFEYHVDMMRMMGFAGGWHKDGAAINIHLGSREGGVGGFLKGLKGLSTDARNLITIENDEYSYGLDDLQAIADHVPIVLDLHHEWIYSKGQYVQPDDPRLDYVKASWRGVRPLGHFSTSHESVLVGHDPDVLPDFADCRAKGIILRDLRAHSDRCWNNASNAWALSHLEWMDIEVEAKHKNLASTQLYEQSIKK